MTTLEKTDYTKTNYSELDILNIARKQKDLYLMVYMLRDLNIVKEARLDDYAWALYKDSNVSINDVNFLLEKLDDYILSGGVKL